MFGEHASFIIPSYLISFAALAGVTVFIRHTYRQYLKELRELEAKGAKRRSDGDLPNG